MRTTFPSMHNIGKAVLTRQYKQLTYVLQQVPVIFNPSEKIKKPPCYPGTITQQIAQNDFANILLRPIRTCKFNMLISEMIVGK